MVENHQELQSQVEAKLSDLKKDLKTIELLAHSRNDRLEDKLRRLERQVEQRKQILHLETIPKQVSKRYTDLQSICCDARTTPISTEKGIRSSLRSLLPLVAGGGAQHSPSQNVSEA